MLLTKKISLFLVPLILFPVLGLGIGIYFYTKTNVKDSLFKQVDTVLTESIRRFDIDVKAAESSARLIATIPQVQRYITTEDEEVKYYYLQPQIIKLLKDFISLHPNYYEIHILMEDGTEDTRVRKIAPGISVEPDSSYIDRELIQNSDKDQITALLNNPDKGEIKIYSSYRITAESLDFQSSTSDKQNYGFIVLTEKISSIEEIISKENIKSFDYFLINSEGQNYLQSNHEIILSSFFENEEQYQLFLDGLNKTNGVFHFELKDNFLLTKTFYNDSYLVGVIPKKIVTSEIQYASVLTFLFLFVSVLLLLVFLYFGLRYLFLHPLKKLKLSVGQINKDNLHVEIPEAQRTDEIGELAKSFDEMQMNLRSSMQKIQRLAFRDSLTGLPNRRRFMQLVRESIELADENNEIIALFFLDLDDFKVINDSLGHDMGDIVIRTVAERLSNVIRSGDLLASFDPDAPDDIEMDKFSVYRLGGDEFTVMINNLTSESQVEKIADRMLKSVSEPIILNTKQVSVAVSIGVAFYPAHGETPTSLIKNADIAMYHAKAHGKNCIAIYSHDMNEKSETRMHIESGLRNALLKDQLFLHYQPQYSLISNEIFGAEVLLRWKDENGEFIPPGKFIPIAEESSLIVEIGRFVLNSVINDIKALNEIGMKMPPVAINVSSREMERIDFAEKFIETIEQNQIKPGQIELELTETCIMNNLEQTIACINKISEHGVSIALDDYGTGYSSLAILKKCKINKIKIDRSFIRDIEIDSNDATIISATISLAQRMLLKTVGEGIENKTQLEFLKGCGCEQGQGFYFAKPMSFEEFRKLLEKRFEGRILSKIKAS